MKVLAVCAAFGGLSACTIGGLESYELPSIGTPERIGDPIDDPYDGSERYEDRLPLVTVRDPSLAGRLGAVSAGGTEYSNAMLYYGGAHFDVIADAPYGTAMAVIDLDGQLSELPTGKISVGGDYRAGTLSVHAIGCSGPSYGNWQTDEPADGGTIEIRPSEVKGRTDVFFDLTFVSGRLSGRADFPTAGLVDALTTSY
jgi:hypothetical protein